MKWFIQRLSEPSTGAGLAMLSQFAKTVPALAPYAQALDLLTLLGGTHAVIVPEAVKAAA
jgi:hypothetical protein